MASILVVVIILVISGCIDFADSFNVNFNNENVIKPRKLFDKRSFVKIVSSGAALLVLGETINPRPSFAYPSVGSFQISSALEDANSKLQEYSLPPILFVPPNFSPLVSEIGRGSIKESMSNPIVVQFSHPKFWVVQRTSVNVNGEAGTVAANDYMKGDTSYLYLLPYKENTFDGNKATIKSFILKALSQKGDPVDSLAILQINEGAKGVDGQSYYIVDFQYQLNTEAGFLINRRAVLSITKVGDGYLQGLVSATTDKRWRNNNLEKTLRDVAESFRVYKLNSGIFSTTSS